MNTDFIKCYKEYGKYVLITAIAFFVSIIPYVVVVGFVTGAIFLILASLSLKDLSYTSRNYSFQGYHTKILAGLIIRMIGWILFYLGILRYFFYYFQILIFIDPFALVLLVIGIIHFLIGGAVEMGAWEEFNMAFNVDLRILSQELGNQSYIVNDSVRLLKAGALMFILSFFMITPLIGIILQSIGFLKLSKLRDIPDEVDQKPVTLPASPYHKPQYTPYARPMQPSYQRPVRVTPQYRTPSPPGDKIEWVRVQFYELNRSIQDIAMDLGESTEAVRSYLNEIVNRQLASQEKPQVQPSIPPKSEPSIASSEEPFRYCPECGSKITIEDAHFCINCGKVLK